MNRTAPAAVSLTLLALVAGQAPAAEAKRKPNIVFILADDLGINDLGCYGRKDHQTPNLDRLAKQGARFTSAYCALPICSASRAAIMTGKAPARLHLTTYLPGRPDAPSQRLLHPKITRQLPLEEKTAAELLAPAGYVSGCIGKWHLGGPKFSPSRQGFAVYHPGKANTRPSDTEGGKGEYDLTRAALTFIDRNRDRPFFLYLCHNNPHIPLAARPKLVEKFKDAFNPVYAAMVHTLDDAVGRVLARLDALKLTDSTIVVFTSDNGGLHVLEGGFAPATHNSPYRAGKGFLYEGGTRIPLIVRWPGRVAAGGVIDTPVLNTDWVPTFAEIADLKELKEPIDGVSIAGLLKGSKPAPRTLYWHFPHYTNQGSRPAGAVREGDWKLVEHYEDGRLELFDLAKDRGERHDLARKEPKKAAELKAKLAAWRKAVGAQENTSNPNFDVALHRKLYVDIDVSALKPARTAREMVPRLQAWRQAMDSALVQTKKKE
jgi:arylsulfatase A-like enzyme